VSHEPTVVELDLVTALFERGLEGRDELHLLERFGRGKKQTGFQVSSRGVGAKQETIDSLLGHGLVELDGSGRCDIFWRLSDEGVRIAAGLSDELKPLDIMELLQWFPDNLLFFSPSDLIEGRTAIPWTHTPPDTEHPGDCRLVLLLGDNAGGKSFFRRLLRLVTHPGQEASMSRSKMEPGEFPVHEFIHLSMEMRTSGSIGSSFISGAWHGRVSVSAAPPLSLDEPALSSSWKRAPFS